MFKPANNAKGCLTADVLSVSNVFAVDATLYNALSAVLGVGGTDHTYLKLGVWPNIEVVKVQQLSGGALTVERARDGTIAAGFSTGTELVYDFCSAAARDIAQESLGTVVTLTGTAPIVVTQIATNNFNVSLTPLALTSDDDSVLVVGAWPNIALSVNKSDTGCCS